MSTPPINSADRYLPNAMGSIKHIHLVGIGGSGMAGIAEILCRRQYIVSGSDTAENDLTARLKQLGATLYKGHHTHHISGADVVVYSSAIKPDNPEIQAAQLAQIPIISRAKMLAELMRFHYGIAVAGTHGKTTTTGLIAQSLIEGDLDPTVIVGGRINHFKSNAHLGHGHYFIAEADESDGTFLHLKPIIAVITNIDTDHLQTYDNNFSKLLNTFSQFLNDLPFYGMAVVCLDDPGIKKILPDVSCPIITYGFDPEADVSILNYTQNGLQSYLQVKWKGSGKILPIQLNLPGRYNALNALAALIVAKECQISDTTIAKTLQQFSGIGRRFEFCNPLKINGKTIDWIDDYGHHPNEITYVIQTIRDIWSKRRLILIFQPHRYSRTRDLFDDFVQVLTLADILCLIPIYSAGEEPIDGINSQSLCQAIHKHSSIPPFFAADKGNFMQILSKIIKEGDIILTQGAGNIDEWVKDWGKTCSKVKAIAVKS